MDRIVFILFQSTPLREGRRGACQRHLDDLEFQSTPLREGRLFLSIILFYLVICVVFREADLFRINHYSLFIERFFFIINLNRLDATRTSQK